MENTTVYILVRGCKAQPVMHPLLVFSTKEEAEKVLHSLPEVATDKWSDDQENSFIKEGLFVKPKNPYAMSV